MALTDTLRDVVDKGRKAGGDAVSMARKQSNRARKEVEVRRIQRKIREQKTVIGEAVYARVAAGELKLDAPEIDAAVDIIASLELDLARIRGEIEAVRNPEPDATEPSEGGDAVT